MHHRPDLPWTVNDFYLKDEPSSGMDPNAKRHLWKIITEEVQNQCSVILTSHRYCCQAGTQRPNQKVSLASRVPLTAVPCRVYKLHAKRQMFKCTPKHLESKLSLSRTPFSQTLGTEGRRVICCPFIYIPQKPDLLWSPSKMLMVEV